MEQVQKIPNSEDIMREATKKLEKIKHERDIESKFFSKYDSYQEHLDNFEKNLTKKIFEQNYNHLISKNKLLLKYIHSLINLVNLIQIKFQKYRNYSQIKKIR